MKDKIKTAAAVFIVLIVTAAGFVLDMNDNTEDVYPDDNTLIRLYGEAHGAKMYYDIEYENYRTYRGNELEDNMSTGNWDGNAGILSDAARRLEGEGADFIVIATNTMFVT